MSKWTLKEALGSPLRVTAEVVTSLVKTITYGSEITEEAAIEKDDIACALIGIVENEVILVLAVERDGFGAVLFKSRGTWGR